MDMAFFAFSQPVPFLITLMLNNLPAYHYTLVPCDFDISPLHSDQRRRYRQRKVGSLLVSPRLCVRQICYGRLKKNRLDATINVRFPRDVVQHAKRNVCARGAPCNTSVWNESPLHQCLSYTHTE